MYLAYMGIAAQLGEFNLMLQPFSYLQLFEKK